MTKSESDQDKPKSFEVTLYRSGFDDIEILLAAKDSAQACHKAIKAYGSWNVVRVRNVKECPEYPHISGDHIIIGPECFADSDETTVCWKGRNYRLASEQAETLTMIQATAAKFLALANGGLSREAEDSLFESLTRAFNAGYQAHADDLRAKAEADVLQQDQQEFEEHMDAQAPIYAEPVCGMAEEPEEVKQLRRQRRQDQADLIDLILHYKNPADEEARMRQIRVVMD
jgi:hypothetical protein